MNRSEQFVYEVCRHSFLSLWSHATPRGKDPGKELSDVLVVCDPDIVIVSVKEITVTDSGDTFTDWRRWQKRAIEDSAKQIYGAERWLRSATRVVRADGSLGLELPSLKERRIHRVAVSLGGEGKVPLKFGDFGKGFVHVLDAPAFRILLAELDTITDFVDYLSAKERLLAAGKKVTFVGAEEDLLALYLHGGREFPQQYDRIVIDDTLWRGFQDRPEYKAKNIANADSYVWDKLIEALVRREPEIGPELSVAESAIRIMARENRFARRVLGQAFKEFLEERVARARITRSPSGIVYVFLAVPHGTEQQRLQSELGLRCFVARGQFPENKTVVGIGTEYFENDKSSMLFFYYLRKESWEAEDEAIAKGIREELGLFAAPQTKSVHIDEYPGATNGDTSNVAEFPTQELSDSGPSIARKKASNRVKRTSAKYNR